MAISAGVWSRNPRSKSFTESVGVSDSKILRLNQNRTVNQAGEQVLFRRMSLSCRLPPNNKTQRPWQRQLGNHDFTKKSGTSVTLQPRLSNKVWRTRGTGKLHKHSRYRTFGFTVRNQVCYDQLLIDWELLINASHLFGLQDLPRVHR